MKKLFKSIGDFFKKLFGNIVEEIIENAGIAIAVVDQVEAFIKNPLIGLVLNAIPGPIGDFIRKNEAKILSVLDEAIILITGAQNCATQATDKERLECFVKYMADLPVLQQNALLQKLASIIENLLSGGQSESDSDTAVQMAFKQQQLDGIRPSSNILLTEKIKLKK